MRRWVFMGGVLGLFLSLLSLSGCGGSERRSKLLVVSTTGMIGDIVQNIGGAHVESKTLMGPGVDPHLYRATEGDVRLLSSASIIFYNGLHLEAKLSDILHEMDRGTPTVAVAGTIPKELLLSSSSFQGYPDPHVWFDVPLWIRAAETVRDQLVQLDPKNAAGYQKNASAYIAKLQALHQSILERVAVLPTSRRVLVTAHDAFNYFGRAYGFEVVGLQGISTESAAGAKDVQELADFIVKRRIPAIFFESSIPKRNITAVEEAVRSRGFNVHIGGELFSDALGTPGTPEGTYLGMVNHNVSTIVGALSRSHDITKPSPKGVY